MVADKVCLRCGTQINGSQVFCDDCLSYTEDRPVNPGTPVLLPNRAGAVASRKRFRRRIRKPEEQIHGLKNLVAWLTVLIAVLLVVCVLSVMLNCQLLGVEGFSLLPLEDLSWLSVGGEG